MERSQRQHPTKRESRYMHHQNRLQRQCPCIAAYTDIRVCPSTWNAFSTALPLLPPAHCARRHIDSSSFSTALRSLSHTYITFGHIQHAFVRRRRKRRRRRRRRTGRKRGRGSIRASVAYLFPESFSVRRPASRQLERLGIQRPHFTHMLRGECHRALLCRKPAGLGHTSSLTKSSNSLEARANEIAVSTKEKEEEIRQHRGEESDVYTYTNKERERERERERDKRDKRKTKRTREVKKIWTSKQ